MSYNVFENKPRQSLWNKKPIREESHGLRDDTKLKQIKLGVELLTPTSHPGCSSLLLRSSALPCASMTAYAKRTGGTLSASMIMAQRHSHEVARNKSVTKMAGLTS
jgi:hypothetical protein